MESWNYTPKKATKQVIKQAATVMKCSLKINQLLLTIILYYSFLFIPPITITFWKGWVHFPFYVFIFFYLWMH